MKSAGTAGDIVVILRYFDTQCDSLGFFLDETQPSFTNYDCISACCLLACHTTLRAILTTTKRLERMSYGPDLNPEASIKEVFSSKSIPSQQVLKY